MINKLKKVTFSDVLGIFKYLLIFIPAFIYHIYLKLFNKQLWVICETKNTARDNGFVFYNYMIDKHPEVKTYYAISKKCSDYNKFSEKNNIIRWGSIKHYFLYCAATYNISSHKEGNPNQSLFTILHVYLKLYNNRVFLQHGIINQYYKMFTKKHANFKVFISGAKLEYEYLVEKYGYKDEIKYTGLARYDNLIKKNGNNRTILFIPTWRRFINNINDLEASLYFRRIKQLLNSSKLDELLKKYNYTLLYYPHQGFAKLNYKFNSNSDNIKLLDFKNSDIQKLLIDCDVMITDFSSVHYDFGYMKKPIIFYQYDKKAYYKYHVGASMDDSYFNYETMGFGPVYNNLDDVLSYLETVIKNNNKIEQKYLTRIKQFFTYNDQKNCERIYKSITESR